MLTLLLTLLRDRRSHLPSPPPLPTLAHLPRLSIPGFPSLAGAFLHPTLAVQGHSLLARHSGADAALLRSMLSQHSGQPVAANVASSAAATSQPDRPRTEEEITARCHEIMNRHKVVLFMKGNPSAPKCGFSRQTVGLLREKGVEFAWFDILSDEEVRQGLKRVNDWPTFPQIILGGELVGGLDILKEMIESGEWDEAYADALKE